MKSLKNSNASRWEWHCTVRLEGRSGVYIVRATNPPKTRDKPILPSTMSVCRAPVDWKMLVVPRVYPCVDCAPENRIPRVGFHEKERRGHGTETGCHRRWRNRQVRRLFSNTCTQLLPHAILRFLLQRPLLRLVVLFLRLLLPDAVCFTVLLLPNGIQLLDDGHLSGPRDGAPNQDPHRHRLFVFHAPRTRRDARGLLEERLPLAHALRL